LGEFLAQQMFISSETDLELTRKKTPYMGRIISLLSLPRGARWFAKPISSALKMEAICSSETSVETQRTTRRHIPEDDTLHNHPCEKLKSYMHIMFMFKYINGLYYFMKVSIFCIPGTHLTIIHYNSFFIYADISRNLTPA
jgi:hypothetical protein